MWLLHIIHLKEYSLLRNSAVLPGDQGAISVRWDTNEMMVIFADDILLSARLQYLQCISNGDMAVLH